MAGEGNTQRRITMTDILLAAEKQNKQRADYIAQRNNSANQSPPVNQSSPANQASPDIQADISLENSDMSQQSLSKFNDNASSQQSNVLEQPPPANQSPPARNVADPLPQSPGDSQSPAANLSSLLSQEPVSSNWTAMPNEVYDKVLPLLKPQDQVILIRLYRLSKGFKNDTCLVTIGRLANSCNISSREVYRSVERLEATGLIKRISVDFNNKNAMERGTTYRVNLPIVVSARQTGAAKQSPRVKQSPPDGMADIKYVVNKDTHTNTKQTPQHNNKEEEDVKRNVVGVGSRFSLEECENYAQHLHETGRGINNPGGYATSIHRSGEADTRIEEFLKPPTPKQRSVDITQCPDCNGTGYWYPQGQENGVARCKHEQLLSANE